MITEISILVGVLALQVVAALLIIVQLAQSSDDLREFVEAKTEPSDDDSDSRVSNGSVPESESKKPVGQGGFLIGHFDWEHVAKVHARLPEMEQPAAIADDYYFWLKSLFPSQLLERVFVVAPLVGVLITCIGFISNDIDPENLKKSMSPLLVGVGGGALLALVNQILLFFVNWRTTKLGLSAVSSLPSVCFQDEGQRLRELSLENLGRVVEALERSAAYHEKIASELKTSIEQVLVPINTTVSEAAVDMSGATSQLVPAIKDIVTAAYDLNSRMGMGLSEFDELSKTVSLLRDLIDQRLGSLIDKQGRAVQRLTESAQNLEGSTKKLDGSTQGLDSVLTGLNNGLHKINASTEFHTVATDRVLDVLDNQLQPSFEKIKDAISTLLANKKYLEDNVPTTNNMPVLGRTDAGVTFDKDDEFAVSVSMKNIEQSQGDNNYQELITNLKDLVREIKTNNDGAGRRGLWW
jgi:hypothetical protein